MTRREKMKQKKNNFSAKLKITNSLNNREQSRIYFNFNNINKKLKSIEKFMALNRIMKKGEVKYRDKKRKMEEMGE